MRTQFETELRGQTVKVDCEVDPPDFSVGIMGYGAEDVLLTDADGNGLDWELTDDEYYKLSECLNSTDFSYEDDVI
jgi:hypothetical protein